MKPLEDLIRLIPGFNYHGLIHKTTHKDLKASVVAKIKPRRHKREWRDTEGYGSDQINFFRIVQK